MSKWLNRGEAGRHFTDLGIRGLSSSSLGNFHCRHGRVPTWWLEEFSKAGGPRNSILFDVEAIAAAVAEWTGDEGAITATAGGSLREDLIRAQTRRTEAQATQEEIRAKAALQDFVAIADLQSLFSEMQTLLKAAHGRLSRLPNDGVEAHRILDEALQQCEQLTAQV